MAAFPAFPAFPAIRYALYPLMALLLALWTVAASSGALAQSMVDDQRLDTLFGALALSGDAEEAEEIVAAIWREWSQPDDPELAALMRESAVLSQTGRTEQAITVLDEVVLRWPDYAEGWNRRATLHFVLRDLDASLADIAETLAREPRHFGALSGRVQIELARGEDEKARETMIEALRIHPYMSGRERFPDLPQPLTRA